MKVCQAYKFYEIIGDEDKNSIIIIEKTPEIIDSQPEVEENVEGQAENEEEPQGLGKDETLD